MAKTLIAYFSHAGENYFGGHIRSISKGNTAVAAEFVQKATGGTLFEIRTVKDYPVNYKACTDIAAEEGRANTRSELRGPLPDIGTYDTIVLGYPCWWGTMPQAVFTFLESADFTGKKILPFCTHEGSGESGTAQQIQSAYSKAVVFKALAMRRQTAQKMADAAKRDTLKWLAEIKVK